MKVKTINPATEEVLAEYDIMSKEEVNNSVKNAKKAGAVIVASGSYKYENKVNNALVFPYLMRAILDLGIRKITMNILYSTSLAIANTVTKKELSESHIIPDLDDKRLQPKITATLMKLGKSF